jgi:UDP-N-acetylglucosamine/UDP-N-acetyl-alpha-D-glucosaminouronate 4-epimerase
MKTYENLQQDLKQRPRAWLVTGAAGFIGSHLVETLLRLDQRVTALDNFSTGKRANLDQVRKAVADRQWQRLRLVEGDIGSLETCRQACRSAQFVLHQAALGSVPRSIEDPLGTHASNLTGFVNIAVAARDAGVTRLVYAGSSATYGDHPGQPSVERQIGQALSPYALTKHVDELYAGLFARCYGFDSIGLRYFNVFGPRQDPEGAYAAVIPQWIARMIRGDTVYINGDGETSRDYCYVDNVVQANLLAALAAEPAAVNQVYNVALGGDTSLNQLFEILRSLLEARHPRLRDLRPVHREFRAGDVRRSQADIGKAQRLLGYRPAWPVSEGLARTIDWYAAQLSRPPAIVRTALAESQALSK